MACLSNLFGDDCIVWLLLLIIVWLGCSGDCGCPGNNNSNGCGCNG